MIFHSSRFNFFEITTKLLKTVSDDTNVYRTATQISSFSPTYTQPSLNPVSGLKNLAYRLFIFTALNPRLQQDESHQLKAHQTSSSQMNGGVMSQIFSSRDKITFSTFHTCTQVFFSSVSLTGIQQFISHRQTGAGRGHSIIKSKQVWFSLQS